jgi:hypothetical protein
METKLRQNLPQLRRGRLAERNPNPLADNLGRLNKPGLLVFKSSKTLGVGKVRFFFRASASIGKRASFFCNCAACASAAEFVRITISGVGQESLHQFFGSFHNLFFSALLCVFRLSPFTKKRNRQPSPVEVVFRRSHERAGWFWADAVRARDVNETQETENTPVYRAASKLIWSEDLLGMEGVKHWGWVGALGFSRPGQFISSGAAALA